MGKEAHSTLLDWHEHGQQACQSQAVCMLKDVPNRPRLQMVGGPNIISLQSEGHSHIIACSRVPKEAAHGRERRSQYELTAYLTKRCDNTVLPQSAQAATYMQCTWRTARSDWSAWQCLLSQSVPPVTLPPIPTACQRRPPLLVRPALPQHPRTPACPGLLAAGHVPTAASSQQSCSQVKSRHGPACKEREVLPPRPQQSCSQMHGRRCQPVRRDGCRSLVTAALQRGGWRTLPRLAKRGRWCSHKQSACRHSGQLVLHSAGAPSPLYT